MLFKLLIFIPFFNSIEFVPINWLFSNINNLLFSVGLKIYGTSLIWIFPLIIDLYHFIWLKLLFKLDLSNKDSNSLKFNLFLIYKV